MHPSTATNTHKRYFNAATANTKLLTTLSVATNAVVVDLRHHHNLLDLKFSTTATSLLQSIW
jgi:hypothetical protein